MKIIAIILVLLLLYLLAIMPRLCNRPDYKPFYGRMYAHRGLHNMNPSLREANSPYCNGGNYPENSYAAIKRAVEQGFGIELMYILPRMEYLLYSMMILCCESVV